MPLFRQDKLSPAAQRVINSYKMVNSSSEFEDERAATYMEENRSIFSAEAGKIVNSLTLPRK